MLLPRELIGYLARQLVIKLNPQVIETTKPQAVVELVTNLIVDELQVEDRLNDEVREILSQYADYMRREGVSYQEMFRRIKNTLIAQRKSHDVRVKRDPNDLRLELVRQITELLHIEDKVDKAARQKIQSQKRVIAEGTEEWDLLLRRYNAEELKKMGIAIAR